LFNHITIRLDLTDHFNSIRW